MLKRPDMVQWGGRVARGIDRGQKGKEDGYRERRGKGGAEDDVFGGG